MERAGDASFARSVARSLVPSASRVGDDGAAFDAARAKLVSRYLALTPRAPVEAGTPSGEDAEPGTPSTEAPVALTPADTAAHRSPRAAAAQATAFLPPSPLRVGPCLAPLS
jgi:hypothetical protein